MKHLQTGLLVLFLIIIPFSGVKAQQNRFIYIQTEDKQAFYVKLDNKLHSSSGSGYIVLPKLKEGTYRLVIGFPKSEWKEQSIDCIIDKNDAGYLLKNFGDKGWGLFNLQTLSVINPDESGGVDKNVEIETKTDAFSNMLSSVVNDSTIRQTEKIRPIVNKVPEKEAEPALTLIAKEKEAVKDLAQQSNEAVKITEGERPTTDVAKNTETSASSNDQQAVSINEIRSSITRSLFNKNSDGIEMMFIDELNGNKDTVRVFIPAEKDMAFKAEEKAKEIEKPKEDLKAEPVKQEAKAKDTRFLEIEIPGVNTQTEAVKTVENKKMPENDGSKTESKVASDKQTEPVIKKATMINSDCKSMATEDDFLKLRKKMAAEDNDDDMIVLAKKIFKTKCFTVEQVKNLSVLFLKDAGKYAFFDMTYPFVSDSENFSTLQSQLSDTYYISRFQVMIRH